MTALRSEVFMREDLAAILDALALTAQTAGDASPHAAAFRRGFAAALVAVATAIHITPDELPMRARLTVVAPDRPQLENHRRNP